MQEQLMQAQAGRLMVIERTLLAGAVAARIVVAERPVGQHAEDIAALREVSECWWCDGFGKDAAEFRGEASRCVARFDSMTRKPDADQDFQQYLLDMNQIQARELAAKLAMRPDWLDAARAEAKRVAALVARAKAREDRLASSLTAFESFNALVEAPGGYRPTLRCLTEPDKTQRRRLLMLANLYDREQVFRGDPRRVHRT